MSTTFKYSLFAIVIFAVLEAKAQNQSNSAPQAVVTIVGDPVENNNDFLGNNNPYQDNNTNGPPSQQQMAQINTDIEPSLENGFHVRFDLNSSEPKDRVMASGYMSSGSGKVKKHAVSMTERSFNLKKKIKTWMPKHKKKYRPHLCGRF